MTAGLAPERRLSFLVVGGGAAGTLVAARLLDESVRRGQAITVTLVDASGRAGRGIAYSATDPRHVLNVPAGRMSAYPEDADHFLRWLRDAGHDVDPAAYVPRSWYGDYLTALLGVSARRAVRSSLEVVDDEVIDLVRVGERCQAITADGRRLEPADHVVLALGHLGVDTSWAPAALVESGRLVDDPWRGGVIAGLPDDAPVLCVGTGLTMVDVAVALDRPGRQVVAVSRNGFVPHPHAADLLAPMEPPGLSDQPDLAELRAVMTAHLGEAQRRYGDWRPAIDSVRAITAVLWGGLSLDERAEFVGRDARAWDAARHRIPPASAATIAAARDAGRLRIGAATVVGAVDVHHRVRVDLSTGESVDAAAVVNCTGPCDRPAYSASRLVASLLDQGAVRPGPLGIGFDTRSDGHIVEGNADANWPLWTLGALRKGTLWESTAMPEIRAQAAALARALLGTEQP